MTGLEKAWSERDYRSRASNGSMRRCSVRWQHDAVLRKFHRTGTSLNLDHPAVGDSNGRHETTVQQAQLGRPLGIGLRATNLTRGKTCFMAAILQEESRAPENVSLTQLERSRH